VLVEDDETPQDPGSDLFDEDGVGGPIPPEDPVRKDALDLFLLHPDRLNSSKTSCGSFPFINASVWAKKIAEEDSMVISNG